MLTGINKAKKEYNELLDSYDSCPEDDYEARYMLWEAIKGLYSYLLTENVTAPELGKPFGDEQY